MAKRIYCNKCRYYIAESKVIGKRDICGFTIKISKDCAGNEVAELDQNVRTCEECNTILEDNRNIKHLTCQQKNKGFNCGDFKRRNIISFITDIRKLIYRIWSYIDSQLDKNVLYMAIVWFGFNCIMLYNYVKNLYGVCYFTVFYIIISITYFGYAIKHNRQ